MNLADQGARERILLDLDTTLVVEAAAGTGKTSALVGRMVYALTSGRARLDEMIAVTFTDAAAGELKLRLRTRIEQSRRDAKTTTAEQERLTAALARLEEARIGTIHAFCADLLRERPVEAGVDPLFEVASDGSSTELFDRAFSRWFEGQLEEPAAAVRRILRRELPRGDTPRRLLKRAAWDLLQRRDFPTRWKRQPFDRDQEIDGLLGEIRELGRWADHGPAEDYFVRSLAELQRFGEEIERREALRHQGRDYDGVEAALGSFARRWHGKWKGYRKLDTNLPKAELLARRDALRERLEAFVRASGADLAPDLRDSLWAVVEGYEALKEKAGCLDFLDLLVRARDLLRDDRSVRGELQQRFRLIFVDEFQDTDPLQAEILLLLAADDPAADDWQRARPVAGKLFFVGDPKQSIYRFRRADVALYQAVKEQLCGHGAEVLHLTVSFRSVPELQRAVNAAFAPLMDGSSASQADYVPLSPHRAAIEKQPALIALPVPAPYGDYGKIVSWRIDDSLPVAVAALVSWLVEHSGWEVTEAGNARVPLRPRHVCLLFRRFRTYDRDVTRPYARALEARGLAHVLVGGSAFHQREEVEALRNILTAIEWPEDELSVFAALKGPFFAVSDEALLAYRSEYSTLHPFRRLPDELPEPMHEVAGALAVLRELHRGRNRRPFADTVGRLLGAVRAHAGLAIWPTGEQALANVSRLLDMARRAEARGATSFRAFVQELARDAEEGIVSDAPIVEPGVEGVRVMTVHRAKGLEFPVVILADLTATQTPKEAGRYVDSTRRLCAMRIAGCSPPELLEHGEDELRREEEEASRLLYVASTRARDLLVVPVVGDERRDGWVQGLNPVVYPRAGSAPLPEAPEGCPSFGEDATVDRPARVTRPLGAVSPGLHQPEAGDHRVVWWDPHVLDLDVPEAVGLRQQALLTADEEGVRSEAGISAHAAWQEKRTAVREAGRAPTQRVCSVTEASEEDAPDSDAGASRGESTVEIADARDGKADRPHGKRFGALVHATLAAVSLDAKRDEIARVARLQARILGGTEEEVAGAVRSVVAALAHPLMRRAATAVRCYREWPVHLVDGRERLLEGLVDLAFEEVSGWTVVDFKTDVELASRRESYERQVSLYARAVADATGRPATPILLKV